MDYLFGTKYVPKNGENIEARFHGNKDFPKDFGSQVLFPFINKNRSTQQIK